MRSFLTPAEEAVYGRFTGQPEQAVLDRFFFLDDADRDFVASKRGDHNRLGFSLQLVTVRHLGRFLEDPLDGRAWWSTTWPRRSRWPTRRV
ncbi:DUF4158 domain-containing protein [Actinoplanes sp. NPDC051346]|uniref:DUF4158 domain-containing protein n=1 Tax=Actinoplanes sp. NPDC051346 TaxID=3155048 RepID=UPI00341BCACF